jgi:tetratricopeptide (TPR) repeat protein
LAPQWPLPPSEAGKKVKTHGDDADEAKARALFAEAMALVRAEKYDEALAKFREDEKLAPRDFAVKMNIGICLMYLDRAREAVSVFEKASAIDPDKPAAHAMICSSRNESGDRSAAIDECRAAVRLSNGAAEYKALLGKMLLLDGSKYEALEILNSISQTPDSPFALLAPLADMYMLAGEYEQAAGVYEQIKQRWPNVTITWYRLSYAYEFLDRPQQAVAAARKYAELRPNSSFAQLSLGERLARAEFFEESIAPFSRAVALDPGYGDA